MRRVRLACFLALCLLTPSEVARAQNVDPVDRQHEIEAEIRQLREAIGEASAEEARLIRALGDVQDRLDDHDATIAGIDRELGAANARLSDAQADVERLDGRYIALTRQLQDTNREIDSVEDDVSDIAAELYRRAGSSEAAFTSLALDAETPQDLFAGTRYLTETAAADRAEIDRLSDLKAEVAARRAALDHQREEAKAARDVVAAEQARIASLKRDQLRARASVASIVQEQQALLGQIRSRKSQFSAEIAALQAESNSITGLLRDRQSGQVFVPSGSGVLAVPVTGSLSSGFGPRVHPILGTSRMHNGVDFAASSGSPIRAAGAGEVVWAGPRGGYGNTVIIDHGNTLATLYAHQSSVGVGVGQVVTQGQYIGAVGSTGLSTGPHLHFEVRVRGVPVNPLQYL